MVAELKEENTISKTVKDKFQKLQAKVNKYKDELDQVRTTRPRTKS